MATQRDRATGWQHAKRSGHKNEAILEALMLHDIETQQYFLDRVKDALVLKFSFKHSDMISVDDAI